MGCAVSRSGVSTGSGTASGDYSGRPAAADWAAPAAAGSTAHTRPTTAHTWPTTAYTRTAATAATDADPTDATNSVPAATKPVRSDTTAARSACANPTGAKTALIAVSARRRLESGCTRLTKCALPPAFGMCGRYRVTNHLGEVFDHFGDLAIHRPFTPRFNLAPTQEGPIVYLPEGKPALEMMRWGLVPSWSKDTKGAGKCINARIETAADKSSFRAAFKHRRCLVPAHGYYEWQTTPQGKQPWHFHRKGDALMCFAGLWESWVPPASDERPLHSFAILTSASNPFAARWHDRMPVLMPPDTWDAWLDDQSSRGQLQTLLRPYAFEDLEAWPVTRRMNTPRFESPECITPIEVGSADLKLE